MDLNVKVKKGIAAWKLRKRRDEEELLKSLKGRRSRITDRISLHLCRGIGRTYVQFPFEGKRESLCCRSAGAECSDPLAVLRPV